jgi:membrane protein DedA with SNARE-associated domain/rhodanese-related sulfurtransferase
MGHLLDLVARHGGALVFAIVFLDQLGLPIPSVPVLLAFGALAGSERIDPVQSLLLAVSGCLCADLIWFQLGRWKGGGVLGLLCRVALEPDSCVSKTRDLFARHGVKSLLVAKFIPGFDTVAPPLAGMLGVRTTTFLLWSTGGALLWLLVYGGAGYLFSERIEELAVAADRLGSSLVLVLLGLTAAYLAWKYLGRRRVLRSIRMARITPDELHQAMQSGQAPMIVDARSKAALDALPFTLQGAHLLALDEIDEEHPQVSLEREIIVYCSCPNEVSSARVALKLKRLGAERVRPLAGGIEKWHALHLPVVPREVVALRPR